MYGKSSKCSIFIIKESKVAAETTIQKIFLFQQDITRFEGIIFMQLMLTCTKFSCTVCYR